MDLAFVLKQTWLHQIKAQPEQNLVVLALVIEQLEQLPPDRQQQAIAQMLGGANAPV